ncbi:hypothetical protein, partial [Klebsiella pneumoniae]|uniref:hypothetical protein n=1 Tax=Klebsiella pneumoniae TaxID=573 RepID=UPI003EB7C163
MDHNKGIIRHIIGYIIKSLTYVVESSTWNAETLSASRCPAAKLHKLTSDDGVSYHSDFAGIFL